MLHAVGTRVRLPYVWECRSSYNVQRTTYNVQRTTYNVPTSTIRPDNLQPGTGYRYPLLTIARLSTSQAHTQVTRELTATTQLDLPNGHSIITR